MPGEIALTSDMQMTPPLWQKVESEKVGLKLNIQNTKIMASGPITSWHIDGETVETVADFIFLGSKSPSVVILEPKKIPPPKYVSSKM